MVGVNMTGEDSVNRVIATLTPASSPTRSPIRNFGPMTPVSFAPGTSPAASPGAWDMARRRPTLYDVDDDLYRGFDVVPLKSDSGKSGGLTQQLGDSGGAFSPATKALPADVTCAISGKMLRKPVKSKYGHVFEEVCFPLPAFFRACPVFLAHH